MTKSSEKYDYNSSFPTILRALMEERKVTQQKIAEICSVKPQSVSQWRNGETRPDILSLAKIAKHFGVSTDYLLGLTDYKTTNKATKELCDTLGLSETAVSILLGEGPLQGFENHNDSVNMWRSFAAENAALAFNVLAEDFVRVYPHGNEYREQSFIELINLLTDHLSADTAQPIRFTYQREDGVIEDVKVMPQKVFFETETNSDVGYTQYDANIQKLMIDSIINDITAKLHDKKREALSRDAKARAEREGETQ